MLAITPTRTFNLLYILIDSLFIVFFLGILLWKKRKAAFWFSIFGGILYFIVDFGYFYIISRSRVVKIDYVECNALYTGLVLLWMSLSYGITNFAFIWLCIKKDENLKEFLLLIVGWWLVAPTIAYLGPAPNIMTYRTTHAYHGMMGVILVIGYGILIIYNLKVEKAKRVNILWLNLIGISVQFSWEFALLIHGIRPMTGDFIQTLMVNSLIETNLGMPIIYGIYLLVNRKFTEDLQKKEYIERNVNSYDGYNETTIAGK